MEELDKPRSDHLRSKSWRETLPGGKTASPGESGVRAVRAKRSQLPLDFGRPGRLAALTATLFVVLLMLAGAMLAAPAISSAQVAVGVSVTFAPPALPIYVQPLCPGPGYIWVPGYWAWDSYIGYYWVPGTWVLVPFPGALWTPGYWAWSDGVFVWYEGYWGLAVGFYGGIDYGFGYTGYGYYGGYWRGGTFYYNRAVNNVSVRNITTVYNRAVTGPVTRTRVSYNGGPGGTTLRPTPSQLAAERQRRSSATAAQKRNLRAARRDRRQRATVNHGRPAVAATAKAGMFSGRGVMRSSRAGAPYKAPPQTHRERSGAHAGTPHPSGPERRPPVNAPKHAAPPARIERHVTPRSEPGVREHRAGPERRTREAPPTERERRGAAPAPAPERPTHAAPPSEPEHRGATPHVTPERQERPHGPHDGDVREKGGPR
jgi:hypothetical protein